ncbi:uncharacterized protein [Ambystoma mexicanum]
MCSEYTEEPLSASNLPSKPVETKHRKRSVGCKMGKWSQYKKSYRGEWESDPELREWIMPVDGDKTKASCRFCHRVLRAHYHDLKVHSETKKHRSRCGPSAATMAYFAVPTGLIPSVQKRREMRIAAFAACNTSINAIDDLGEILNAEVGLFRMRRRTCAAVINSVLGPYFKEQLLADIDKAPYTLHFEELTGASMTTLLCVYIRYFSAKFKQFVIDYLGMIEASSPSTDDLARLLGEFLNENCLRHENMIGISTDGATVMCSKDHSVFTILKKRQPFLQLVSCACHSLDNIVINAGQSLPSNLEFMIRETYNYFAHSENRQAESMELYRILVGASPLELTCLRKTCWIVMADWVERILEQYDALESFFCQTSHVENCFVARLLQEMYADESNFLYLAFLKPLLLEIKAVNQAFHRESWNAADMCRDLQSLYTSTLQRVVKPRVMRSFSEEELLTLDLQSHAIYLTEEDTDLGFTFQQKIEASKLSMVAKQEIVRKCCNFVKMLLKQSQMQLRHARNVQAKTEFLSPKKVLAHPKPSVAEWPGTFLVYPLEVLESQWRNMSSCIFTEFESVERFWIEVLDYTDTTGNHCFQELALEAIRVLLTFPVSNLRFQSKFSELSFLKADLQTGMGLTLLSNMLHVRYGLQRIGLSSASFVPDQELLKRFTCNIYAI